MFGLLDFGCLLLPDLEDESPAAVALVLDQSPAYTLATGNQDIAIAHQELWRRTPLDVLQTGGQLLGGYDQPVL